jgi:hypothetical protein
LSKLCTRIGEEEELITVLNEYIENNESNVYDKVLEVINDEENDGNSICLLFFVEKIMQDVGFISVDNIPEISIVDCDMWGNTYSLHDISYVLTCLAIGLVSNGVLRLPDKLRRRTDNPRYGPTEEEIKTREVERAALEEHVVKIVDLRKMYNYIENKMVRDYVAFNQYMRNKNSVMRQFTQMRFDMFRKWNVRGSNKRIRITDSNGENEENNDNEDEINRLRNMAKELRTNRMNKGNNVPTSTSTSTTVNMTSTIDFPILPTSSTIHNAYSSLSTSRPLTNSSSSRQVVGISHGGNSKIYGNVGGRNIMGNFNNNNNNVGSTSSIGNSYMSIGNGLGGNMGIGIGIGGNRENGIGLVSTSNIGVSIGWDKNRGIINPNTTLGIGGIQTSTVNNGWDATSNSMDTNQDDFYKLVCDTPCCTDNIDSIQTCLQCGVSYCESCLDKHQDQNGVCAKGSRK